MITKFKLFEGKFPKEDPLSVYSIGDRVVFNEKEKHFKDREGTVIAFFTDDYGGTNEILVKLDTKENGDDGYLCSGDIGEDPDGMSYYTKPQNVSLVEPATPAKIRWYKKGKFIDEGIRWYKNGKLGELEKDDCDHDWTMKNKTMYRPDNFDVFTKYWKVCRKCGEKEEVINKPTNTVKKKTAWAFDNWND